MKKNERNEGFVRYGILTTFTNFCDSSFSWAVRSRKINWRQREERRGMKKKKKWVRGIKRCRGITVREQSENFPMKIYAGKWTNIGMKKMDADGISKWKAILFTRPTQWSLNVKQFLSYCSWRRRKKTDNKTVLCFASTIINLTLMKH